MKKLSVVYAGWGERFTLGHLADHQGQVLFEYSPEALARGLELSPLRLKLRAQAYGQFPAHQAGLPGLLADALPDGWGRLLMDRLFRARGQDPAALSPLDRLAYINGNAMGALLFVPSEGDELAPSEVALLTLANEVREVLDDGSAQVLRQLAVMGGSPHGARPKVLVNYESTSGRMSNSENAPGAPWLIKFQAQGEHKEVCALEVLYAKLARECGLEMPDTAYFDLDKNLAAFGIARFDRENGMRVPLHTVAGALEADFRMPSVDYTDMLRLTRLMTRDEREVLKAYERGVFNVVFHNRDDHTKNFSYRLNQAGQWQMAPAYDLTFCTGPRGEHHMTVCGEGRNPSRTHLLQLAAQAGVAKKSAETVIDRMASVAGMFATHAKDFPIRKKTVSEIGGLIEGNRGRLRA